ncbi:MAG: hypothetical protein AAGA92_04310 [Planctomycetota bacterium]
MFALCLTYAGITYAATQATATVEFIEGGTTEATIDLISLLPGEQGNGLMISFTEQNLSGAGVNLTGSPKGGYNLAIDSVFDVTYSDIVSGLNGISEVYATLRSSNAADKYDASLQELPSPVVLSGGADAHIPEPSTITLSVAVGALLVGTRRQRP